WSRQRRARGRGWRAGSWVWPVTLTCECRLFAGMIRRMIGGRPEEHAMASLIEWKVPQSVQPRAEDYSYDLERALSSVVGLHSIVPPDAFTADTLCVERAGNGVLVDAGLLLTIGYLITEAETVWVHLGDGRVVQGHALGFDQETGFGLVQTL